MPRLKNHNPNFVYERALQSILKTAPSSFQNLSNLHHLLGIFLLTYHLNFRLAKNQRKMQEKEMI
jgi:hypothetical protein